MRKNKYNARKVKVDGIVFASQNEADRWRELKLLERAGKITELRRQVPFLLIPTQREFCSEIDKKGRYGKWINVGDFVKLADGTELPVKVCSVCGEFILLEDFQNFCPNCGAKMRQSK